MSAYINIAVSLILVYLIVSLVVTACNEIVSTLLKTRPRMLVQTIVEIIGNDDLVHRFYGNGLIRAARQSSTAAIKAWKVGKRRAPNPLLQEYMRGHPSYIEGKNFAKALTMAVVDQAGMALLAKTAKDRAADLKAANESADVKTRDTKIREAIAKAVSVANGIAEAVGQVDPGRADACKDVRDRAAAAAAEADSSKAADSMIAPLDAAADLAKAVSPGLPTIDTVKAAVNDLPPGALRDAMSAALMKTGQTLEGFEQDLATWYDTTQERLTGAYARYQKYVALGFGALLALLLNVDTIQIAQRLSHTGDVLSQQTLKAAEAVARSDVDTTCAKLEPGNLRNQCYLDSLGSLFRAGSNANVVDTAETQAMALATANCSDDDAAKRMDCVVEQAFTAFDEIAPLLTPWNKEPAVALAPSLWLYKAIGLLITTLAVSLGAPFWFDMLSMFVNIRGAGTKPKTDQKQK